MAYRERGMVEVREMVRRWLGGEGVRAIARATGMDRKAIGAYVRAARAVGVERGGAPPTDEQLTTIAATRRPGRPTNTTAVVAALGGARGRAGRFPGPTAASAWISDLPPPQAEPLHVDLPRPWAPAPS